MPESIGAGLSSLGNFASSIPSTVGNWFSGGASVPGAAPGTSTPMDAGTGPVPSGVIGDPTVSAGGSAPPVPPAGAITGGNLPGELPPTQITPSDQPFSPTGGTPGMTGAQLAAAPPMQDPAQTTTQKVLAALFGTPANPNAPGGGSKATPGILSGMAAGSTDLLKYLQQRSLQDPSALAKAAQKMNAANAAALRKQIYPQLAAQGQETGQINAPYLMNQAYTTAVAPILAQMQQAAMNQWLEANRLTSGLYPGNQDLSTLAGLVEPGIYGGGGRS